MRVCLGSATLFDACLVEEASMLLMLEDEAFVHSALGILVDAELGVDVGLPFVWLLRQGYSKLFVVAQMADQWGESFRPGRLPGLRRRLKQYQLTRLPIVGTLMCLVFNLPSESRAQRRLRVIENQLYLLAKIDHGSRADEMFECVPWGGFHRLPLLQMALDAEANMSPAIKSTYCSLINAANRGSVRKPVPNALVD